jgi:hypothetical protein
MLFAQGSPLLVEFTFDFVEVSKKSHAYKQHMVFAVVKFSNIISILLYWHLQSSKQLEGFHYCKVTPAEI